jgi:hypothetical protein
MEQTLEEAAMQELNHSYATVIDGELAYQRNAMLNMFHKGANWQAKQSPWISVEDRLPDNDENVFYTNHLSGALGIGFYIGEKWYQAYTGDDIYGITYWMPIPKFNII